MLIVPMKDIKKIEIKMLSPNGIQKHYVKSHDWYSQKTALHFYMSRNYQNMKKFTLIITL